ncbi:tRNA-dihydrouridine(20) synthase [NAD(P)+]-like [Microplitis mediator]|uniref:tRNA-dihydrouridine(20) synthase [NAD(P)+]-like n=1 Tax=Microplitis mediator TaxID=375433 RepID=UPI002555F1DC|nr:tRNA-dihydrouridine(20) synthase [NAD(P)+]-like [Microplitis mediator]
MDEKKTKLTFDNKIILAPMVRAGTLPLRLLALDYGADIVYTEELIDFKLLRSTRQINDVLGTIDYIDQTDGTIVFRTCLREKSHVVLQLGTSDPERALKVAQILENDVSGIDINMGCPKKFSLEGGMGAALLNNEQKAKNILKRLIDGVRIPVTCKIRVFDDLQKTLNLCDTLESSGISAITVHGRTVHERPQHANRNEMIRIIAQRLSIPVIANGGSKEIEKYSDIEKFKKETACSSVMLARAAQWNCSIFRKEGLLPIDIVIKAYLKYAIDYDNSPSNTKYCVQNIIRELQETPLGKEFLKAQTLEQICEIWDMDDYCRLKFDQYQKKGFHGRFQVAPLRIGVIMNENHSTKNSECNVDDLIVLRCAFLRRRFSFDNDLPKTKLLKWLRENKKTHIVPVYHTWFEDKLFRSIVTVDNKRYSSTFWEKNKKRAEQGAALVCLCSLGVIDEELLKKNGSLRK